MKTMLLGVVAALAMLCGRAEAVTVGVGTYELVGYTVGPNGLNVPNFVGYTVPSGVSLTGEWHVSATGSYASGGGATGGFQLEQGFPFAFCATCHSLLFLMPGTTAFSITGSGSYIVTPSQGLRTSGPVTLSFNFSLPDGASLRQLSPALSPVPLPATLPLFASVLGLAGWLGFRRVKRLAPAFA